MTWYIGICSSSGNELIIWVNFMVKCVCVGFGYNDFVTKIQPFPMDGHYRTYVISGMGHPRSNSIVPLVLCMVCCAIARVLALYYRSLRTASTLLRRGNISGRPYCYFICIYHLHDNCHLIILHVFYKKKKIHKLKMDTSCAFILTKSSDLPLYYFLFFSICTIMMLQIVDTVKYLVMLEDSIREMLEDLLYA